MARLYKHTCGKIVDVLTEDTSIEKTEKWTLVTWTCECGNQVKIPAFDRDCK